MLTVQGMSTLVLNEAELLVELNRLICATLDTRKKLLACSLRAGGQAIGFLARNSASALATAAHELTDLVRRLGGATAWLEQRAQVSALADMPDGQDLLDACEQAIGAVACQYRDALELRLPEPMQELLMRQFAVVIANYQHLRDLQARLQVKLGTLPPRGARQ